MKILTMMRHGKSSWDYNVEDRQRPLKSRGTRDARIVAEQFVKISEIPDKIISSPAKRALDTCKIATKVMGLSHDAIEITENLYDFGGGEVIKHIKSLPSTVHSVMIFGHNYAFTSIVNTFGSVYLDNLPTSGLVQIEFDIDGWDKLTKGITKHVLIPKELR